MVPPAAQSDHGAVLHQWFIPEYAQHERGRIWYLVAGLVAAALVTYGAWTANFLFAVIVLLAVIILLARHAELPPHLSVTVAEDGIGVGEAFYSYRDLQRFWLIYQPPAVKTLYVEFRSGWRPRLPVPLEDEDPAAVRRTLARYLEEDLDRESEPTSDALSRVLKL